MPDTDQWVYGFTLEGARLGRCKLYENMPGDHDDVAKIKAGRRATAWLLLKRKSTWVLFELKHPTFSPIPERVMMRMWALGYDPLEFPTRNAAHVFMKLRGS